MTPDDCLGKTTAEVEKKPHERAALEDGASVSRFAIRIETAFVTYAYGAAVEGAAMCAYLIKAAMLSHCAILADVIVIANFDEATGEMVALKLLNAIVAVFPSG